MIIKTAVLSGVFWLLTLLFPAITLTGLWTVVGVVVLFTIFNIIYQLTVGLMILPFRIITLDLISIIINACIIYILAAIFTTFTIAPGAFWSVVLLALCYGIAKGILFPRRRIR